MKSEVVYDNCILCGNSEPRKSLDIEPKGTCWECCAKRIPKHIPDVQRIRYMKKLVKRKREYYGTQK